jgi:hypothetical protein
MPAAVLFDRRVVVAVDNLQVEFLRCSFKVKKSLKADPNTAEIKVTNLSPASRANMRKRGARVVLLAGYTGTVAQIFAGDARLIDHRKDPTEWTTVIQCGDGERSYSLARFSKSYKKGINVKDVIKDIVNALKVGKGNLDAAMDKVSGQFLTGFSANGNAATELERILSARGMTFSIQDGKLQILSERETTKIVTVLNKASGLIGSPEFVTPDPPKGGVAPDPTKGSHPTQPFLKIKALLQPQIKPGGKVKVESANVKGQLYRAEIVTHTGDTAGGEWYTEIEGVPVSG